MPSPLKKDMRSIEDADSECRDEPSSEAEPERCENYGDIVEALEYIMENRQSQRGQVVEEADSDNKCN